MKMFNHLSTFSALLYWERLYWERLYGGKLCRGRLFWPISLLFSIQLCCLKPVFAGEVERAGHRGHELGAHVHGEARLNIAVEGSELWVELESPAINILGFEHRPSTDAQWSAVRDAQQRLSRIDNLVSFPGCDCRQTEIELEAPFEAEHTDEREERHEGEHTDEHEQRHEGEHSEFHVSFKLKCGAIDKLSSVKLELFSRFPGLEEVELQWISSGGQGSAKVEKTAPSIKITDN